MIHDYYIPALDLLVGDAEDLKERYKSFGIQNPTKYDGMSRYTNTRKDAKTETITIVILRNIFSDKDPEKCVAIFEVED